MGALIILHGLFLLHCNTQTTPIGSLVPQTCEILAIQDNQHVYQALGGDGKRQTLPNVTFLNAWPKVLGTKNPDGTGKTLDERVLLLTQGVATVIPNVATTRIVVPMPDDIWAANVVCLYQKDLLQATSPTVVRSKVDKSDKSIRLAETIILSYRDADSFTLTDGANFKISSKPIGTYNVLALFSWPAMSDCSAQIPAHPSLNQMIDIGNGAHHHPSIRTMGFTPAPGHNTKDDDAVKDFKLPDAFLRPECIFRTATQTGCAPEVIVE
jgi:hypothetical protein